MGSSEHAPVATTAESAGHLPVDAVAVIVLTLGVLLALGIIVAVATNFGRDWSLPDDPYEICMDRAQTIFGRCIRDSRGDTATEQECNRQWLDSTADCAEKYLD